jgi:UDP-glucose:glycoprotein glucosyltransferase
LDLNSKSLDLNSKSLDLNSKSLDLNSKSLDYGIDIRDSSIQWLNDLESDKKYSRWSTSLQEILRPTYVGMLRSIARNIFNLVLIDDPSKDNVKGLLKTAESFYVNDLPIRIGRIFFCCCCCCGFVGFFMIFFYFKGFVFVTNNDEETDGYNDASVALFRAHNYVKQKFNAPKALSFLTDVSCTVFYLL